MSDLGPFTVTDACVGCGACLPTCPRRCIRPASRGETAPLEIVARACIGCGECAEVCPVEACVPLLPGGGEARP